MLNSELDRLAEILDRNRGAIIPEKHWNEIREFIENNHRRFVEDEKKLTPSFDLVNKAFTI